MYWLSHSPRTVAAIAQDLPSTPYLPLDMAVQAAQVALSACAADGYDVSVAIVAGDGAPKVHLKVDNKVDNSGPHTVGSAQG